MARERVCTWCAAAGVERDHVCDRPPGWVSGIHRRAGTGPRRRNGSRTYALTPLGWETAGYALVDGQWQKPEASRWPG